MKPGTSAVLVLEDQGDLEVILRAIRGLGGKVLKTNVDLARETHPGDIECSAGYCQAVPNGDPK